MRLTLSDLAIRNLKAATRGQRTYLDSTLPGFGVRISQGGTKTFTLMHGNDRRLSTIGRYPIISLAKARQRAKEMLFERTLGLTNDAPAMSFEEAFALFKKTHTSKKNRERTAKETERLIQKHLCPRLRNRDIASILTHEVMQLIDRLIDKPGTCIHVFWAARLLFRWAMKRRLIPRSPLEGVDPPVQLTSRERTLSDNELLEVLQKAILYGSTFGRIVQLLIITGQRRTQIAALRGEYIQRGDAVLSWPAGAMKKRAFAMPLTPMAEALLTDAPDIGFAFPARGRTDAPFTGFSKCKKAFDKTLVGVEPWTLHDLRRTFSTGLARLRVLPHIKEMLLAHSSAKDPVEAIYDRCLYIEEQREALLKWESHIQILLSNAESTNGRQLSGLHQDRAQATERRTTRAGRAAA